MRKVLLASLIAAGIGFVAAPAAQAAPVNNTVLKQLIEMDNVTQVGWHSRHRLEPVSSVHRATRLSIHGSLLTSGAIRFSPAPRKTFFRISHCYPCRKF